MIEIARMHAHRVDILDRADNDAVVRLVADDLHLILLPAEHQFLDQHLARRRSVQPALDDPQIFLAVIGDAAAGAAEREGRTDDGGQADRVERLEGFAEIMSQHGARRGETDFAHRLLETLAVFGLVDSVSTGPDHLHAEPIKRAVAIECKRGVQCRLPAHSRQQHHSLVRMLGALALDHLGDDLRRDRLDIGGVR